MLSEPFSTSHKIVPAVTVAAGASGSTAVNGSIIDMEGFEHVCFIVPWGPITGGGTQSIKVQRDTDAAGGTMADITDTSVAVADDYDNKIKYVEVLRPGERYVRLVVSRATQASTFCAIAILYGARKKPVTQHADVTGEVHKDKAEGTA